MEEYFSKGKLILMGEYAVLHGADALCLPLKTGQKLIADKSDDGLIHWKWSFHDDVLADFSLVASTLEVHEQRVGQAGWAVKLLTLIRAEAGHFLAEGAHLHFVNLFPAEWGLGSSSATISSLCRMAKVDPFQVNQNLMGGSGADIASTTATNWFVYRKTSPRPISWELPFSYQFPDNTYFIYTGKKQATASHLAEVHQKQNPHVVSWMQVNDFVYRFLAVPTIPEALKIIYEHELLIGSGIEKDPIGVDFQDFPGKVKSLGAWGGDFFMALTQQSDKFVKNYFQQKGFQTVLNWKELVETKVF
jgi:hypothetical protein